MRRGESVLLSYLVILYALVGFGFGLLYPTAQTAGQGLTVGLLMGVWLAIPFLIALGMSD